MCCQVEDLVLRQFADADCVVKVEAGHYPRAGVGANAKEGFERPLHGKSIRGKSLGEEEVLDIPRGNDVRGN